MFLLLVFCQYLSFAFQGEEWLVGLFLLVPEVQCGFADVLLATTFYFPDLTAFSTFLDTHSTSKQISQIKATTYKLSDKRIYKAT